MLTKTIINHYIATYPIFPLIATSFIDSHREYHLPNRKKTLAFIQKPITLCKPWYDPLFFGSSKKRKRYATTTKTFMNPYTTVKYTKMTKNNFMRPLDIYCSICACAGELVYFPPLYGWFRCHFLCKFVAVAAVAVGLEPVLGAPLYGWNWVIGIFNI